MAHTGAANTKEPKATAQPDAHHCLMEELSQRVQAATTMDEGFKEIASAFTTLNVTIERITLVRNNETSEVTINQNASGVRRDIEAQIAGLTITVTCINPMTPNVNASLQSLVTMAAIAAQQWTAATAALLAPVETSRMIGSSPQMRELNLEIARAARSAHSVLIKGESGTGKTTAALMIHEQSPRADKPFVDLNCAALPEALLESELFGYEKGAFTGAGTTKKGLFETADGGTLFLDEIAEMKPELQAKLLTAIEQKKIRRLGSTKDIQCNVRILTASSRNLQTMIKEGTFREDLYYRIAVLEIQVAPLRERPSDIPALINSRLLHEQELTGRSIPFQIEDRALKALAFYDWPGNIRQLQNVVSRLTARVDDEKAITQTDVYSQFPHNDVEEGSLVLPAAARVLLANENLYSYVARVQLLVIEAATIAEGNHTHAAKRLGYRRSSLVGLKQKLKRGNHSGNALEPLPEIHLAPITHQSKGSSAAA
ncbi:MAG: sigma 54-interacting transcriptional regulator [Pyrinomonadaceae bacterium]